jgi:hypothetical protein
MSLMFLTKYRQPFQESGEGVACNVTYERLALVERVDDKRKRIRATHMEFGNKVRVDLDVGKVEITSLEQLMLPSKEFEHRAQPIGLQDIRASDRITYVLCDSDVDKSALEPRSVTRMGKGLSSTVPNL